jgi:gamma-glutamyltranspeptidase/glutathione hydrolase
MKLLDGFPLKEMGHNSPDYIHTVTEAMKLAFADRDTYYGDPLFVDMPSGLLSDEYANLRRELIDMNRASQIQQPGDPANSQAILNVAPQDYKGAPMRDDDTTTCTVVDKWGNAVSTTPSGWGGVLAEDLGINLNSRMISLNVWDGHPSVVEPGKRPRITLTPSLIIKEGKPVLTISVAGGDQQDQCAIQILLNHIVFGFEPDKAVSAPRFSTRHLHNLFGHQPPRLGTLTVPTGIGEQAMANLRARGHKLDDGPGVVGRPSIILITPDGVRHAAGDPRARRSATAY